VPAQTSQTLAAAVASGTRSASVKTRDALARIESAAALNAFITVDADRALARAADLDRRRAAGETLGPLAGVPLAVKDNIAVRGMRTTAGSRILDAYVPPFDATAIVRLEAAGAVIVGKTNCDEFAMGSSNENSGYGVVRNPWAPDRVPGGSSGGSAAAVAAGCVPLALGSETGGSIRQPAAFCGVVGIKPTYGRISRYGLLAFASSLDQIGPLATTVADAALALAAMAGADESVGTERLQEDLTDETATELIQELEDAASQQTFIHVREHLDDDTQLYREVSVLECWEVTWLCEYFDGADGRTQVRIRTTGAVPLSRYLAEYLGSTRELEST
jgi:aspartyl-tRNA(Asn)/glutamyl-tRNA(Gln) amidotransferase subunit A